MTHTIQKQRKKDKILYKIEGEWDELEITKIISKLDLIDSEYIVKYKNITYLSPEKGTALFFFSYTQKPGCLSFESDHFDFTLEEFVQMQNGQQLK